MKRLVGMAVGSLLIAAAANAQVYRCEAGGKVIYSDEPCGRGGVVLPDDQLRSNTLPSPGSRKTAATAVEAPATSVVQMSGGCPGDVELRNIRNRLSERVIPAQNRVALGQELAKAQRCRSLQLKYSPEDWGRLEGVLRGDF
jgi:hypothetical protein